MSELQKIFFGITEGLLVGFIIYIIPLEDEVKTLIWMCAIGLAALAYSSSLIVSVTRYFKKTLKELNQVKTTNNNWSDIDHLRWSYNRMKHTHKENPNYDYMIRLKSIIDKLEKENKL